MGYKHFLLIELPAVRPFGSDLIWRSDEVMATTRTLNFFVTFMWFLRILFVSSPPLSKQGQCLGLHLWIITKAFDPFDVRLAPKPG